MNLQHMIANWKTTSAGLVMIFGSVIHLVFAVKGHTADEGTWTATAVAVFSGLGLLFAGDASVVKNVASAVDKINATGADPGAVPAAKPQPEEPKTP